MMLMMITLLPYPKTLAYLVICNGKKKKTGKEMHNIVIQAGYV
jgi:hypothetical protein